jgi:rsbT co-antagonist protein RsbR
MTVPLTDSFIAVVLELAPDGIAVTDEMGRIVHANGYVERLFGYGREELAGHTVEMLLPEALRSAHREHRHNFDQLPLTRPMGVGLELWGRHADGTTFPVEVGLSPVSTERGMCTIMAVRPRGERRASEDQAVGDRAVVADHDRMVVALNDRVIQLIFSASLRLHGLYESANLRQLSVLGAAVGDLDSAIREIGIVLFEQRHDSGHTDPEDS